MLQSTFPKSKYRSEPNSLEALMAELLNLNEQTQSEWLKAPPNFDKENHFATLTAKDCHGQTHTLHMQRHSASHIYRFKQMRMSVERKKTQFF